MSREDSDARIGQPGTIKLSKAVIVVPQELTGSEKKAIAMLVDEVEKRTRIHWECVTTWPTVEVPAIGIGPASALDAFAGKYADELSTDGEASASEGYRIRIKNDGNASVVFVVGNDARGVLFGIGHLLRTLRMRRGQVLLPDDLNVTTAPQYRLRGHQLGYRDKTNSYCGWDLVQWEQYIRDLVVFGANAIELIPPRSDDNLDSVHFPLPPMETMVGMSRIADEYGIDVWIWFPAMDEDYSDPATVEFALQEWGEVFRKLPRIDAVFVPGGDPGKTQPMYLIHLLEKQTALLKSVHPKAEMWVSPQGFSQEWMDEFVRFLELKDLDWLTGVVYGPWVRMMVSEFRETIPDRYPIRNYPDITHSTSCQYPVPDWDVAYALTEGREPINPRPLSQAAIFRHTQSYTVGFLTYSEGCNDDVNKSIWSGLGWDPDREVIDILREYSRYFIGERYTEDFAQGLLALERNWEGPLVCNMAVGTTLQQFQAMEESASPENLKSWRLQQALYRAYYDAYTHSRLMYESALEEQALAQLRRAPEKGSLAALAEAERILDLAVSQPIATAWRTRIFQLTEALFQSIHMQLSVRLYQAQSETRGANLDGIDFPLNDRPWLSDRFAAIRDLASETERLETIRAIVQWRNPEAGGFYDDLGSSVQRPHLVKGLEFAEDPGFLKTPHRRFTYRKDSRALRLAWRSCTGSLYDAPFSMHYPGLDPGAQYKVRIIYSTIQPEVMVRLEANASIEVHPYILRSASQEPVEFDIPREATRDGELTLTWHREPGKGRAGRGGEVSEIWVIKRGC